MKNMQSSSCGGHSDFNDRQEKSARHFEVKHYTPGTPHDQMMLDYLIDAGFVWEEAVILIHMREHLYENIEMRQRMEDDHRMHFARWLYANGEVGEG